MYIYINILLILPILLWLHRMFLALAVEEKTLVVLELGGTYPTGELLAAVFLVMCTVWLPTKLLVTLSADVLLLPVLSGIVLKDKRCW